MTAFLTKRKLLRVTMAMVATVGSQIYIILKVYCTMMSSAEGPEGGRWMPGAFAVICNIPKKERMWRRHCWLEAS